jgi:hypothetical protein
MDELLVGLYVGPDQMLPLASIVASATGVLLIFWHKLLKFFRMLSSRLRPSQRVGGGAEKTSS